VDANESSFGPGGENRHEGHPVEPREEETVPASHEEPIMARLPRSRPKRPAPARARAAGASKARSGGSTRRPARPRTSTPASRSRSRTAPAETGAAGTRPSRSGVFGPGEEAPGLPRLAIDGAIEAAKLPIKVGANITFRALDAITKGLRGR
jgi:hypothetical protein